MHLSVSVAINQSIITFLSAGVKPNHSSGDHYLLITASLSEVVLPPKNLHAATGTNEKMKYKQGSFKSYQVPRH